ncbi:heat shock protein beta-8-like [Sinocyclocheilus grahami]|uniref:heat shock protein beta-8-like n=1 Tax=Sinocyclocheilus grahami TaxID=75366 RepID=UPI0007ACF599|nr:PREDICTED: heat shock protein beta-8-like [Sinocyclocheilus grahami]
MAEGDYYTMGNRQRIPRDPFGEQSLASRFMDDDFGLPPFHDELSMDWPGWARPRLSTRLDAPWTGPLSTGFPRGFSARYSEGRLSNQFSLVGNFLLMEKMDIILNSLIFHRIPSDVDPLTVFASLSPEGVLIIEARQTPPYYLYSNEMPAEPIEEPEARPQEPRMASA